LKVRAVYIRLFKAFNYDYLRLHDPRVEPDPWDFYDGVLYPYVCVPLDEEITCVVGANESGKSQLLEAIKFALGERQPEAVDSCRYAKFFGVDGQLSTAQFGVRLQLTDGDAERLGSLLEGHALSSPLTEIWVFRESPGTVRIFHGPTDPIEVADTDELRAAFPTTFSIDTRVELPDSVPISFLVGRANGETVNGPRRVDRWGMIDTLLDQYDPLLQALNSPTPDPATIKSLLPQKPKNAKPEHARQFQLAYDLLVAVGGVDPQMFSELHDALRRETEGLTTAILAKMNQDLSKALNLHRWWSQDEQFELNVDTRDFDVVFTIRDRTASEYSFGERSSGLKYFLSYLVQYLTHLSTPAPAQLLTMDEPDAYLSQQGQQDLLRLFQDFIDRDRSLPRQVVFVTHSPFLVDRNRPERVRVLDKGVDDEGTRVVKNAAHNHFEPLRTAFGGFVGETTFIGNCNLLLEGQTDQIYVAGATTDAQRCGALPTEHLDLNMITLVAAGGAQHVPYMTYLARGRDYDQPAVIVLLDGDDEGTSAYETLLKGIRDKQIISPDYVMQIAADALPKVSSERPGGPLDIEDLVPIELLLQAAADLAAELVGPDEPVPALEDVRSQLDQSRGHYGAIAAAFQAAGSSLRVDKVGLARHVVASVQEGGPGVDGFRDNFRELLRALRRMQHDAERDRTKQTVSLRVNREIDAFIKHHPERATRDELRVLFLDVDRLLDESEEADRIRVRKLSLERELRLDRDLADDVAQYEGVLQKLRSLRYAAAMDYRDAPDEVQVVAADDAAPPQDEVDAAPVS